MTLVHPNKEEDTFIVSKGDIVLIEDDVHHKVSNTSKDELYFVCIFDGKRID